MFNLRTPFFRDFHPQKPWVFPMKHDPNLDDPRDDFGGSQAWPTGHQINPPLCALEHPDAVTCVAFSPNNRRWARGWTVAMWQGTELWAFR